MKLDQASLASRRGTTNRKFRIAMLASATGSNLRTLLELQREFPHLYEIALVVTHGPNVGAILIAEEANVETWIGDFDAKCGFRSQARTDQELQDYRNRSREWHDELAMRIGEWELLAGEIDLLVLAYHRVVDGDLLRKFEGRIINMHPADLSILDENHQRRYVGKHGVELAIDDGHSVTRTSCFFVNEGVDEGSIICRGPAVGVDANRSPAQQEQEQKLLSDPPALRWAVRMIAQNRIRLGTEQHIDGSRSVYLDGKALPLGGQDLTGRTERASV